MQAWMRPTVATVATAVLLFASVGPAGAAEATPSDNLDAIAAVAPQVLSTAANVTTAEEGVNVIASTVGETSIKIPGDPAAGIEVQTTAGEHVTIGLPFATAADHALVEQSGVVSFDNNNGSVTVPVVTENGGITINTIIDGPAAPQQYAYSLELPVGARLTKVGEQVLLTASGGEEIGLIDAPWALDANGNPVATHYEVNDTTLTQVVEHDAGAAYPVVADPTYWPAVISWWSRAQVEQNWSLLGFQSTVCMLPISLLYLAVCYKPATMADAIASAHYQKKRIKQYYYGCTAGGWCSYIDYYVLP